MQGSGRSMNAGIKKINWCRNLWSLNLLIFLIPAFMDLLDPCIHGSSWSLHSWVFLIPAFMGLLDPCVHGSSWSLRSWVFLITAFMDLLDPCVLHLQHFNVLQMQHLTSVHWIFKGSQAWKTAVGGHMTQIQSSYLSRQGHLTQMQAHDWPREASLDINCI